MLEEFSVPFIPGVMKVKRIHPDAVLPLRAKANDAGYDVVAVSDGKFSDDGFYVEYKTGLTLELPLGFHVELFPRSSISKTDLILANGIGLVDNAYRGEIIFRFKCFRAAMREVDEPTIYKKGDRIGQIVIRKTYELPVTEVDELSDTERGVGGFGSSGR
jgi:dUTP pyrophosphatase